MAITQSTRQAELITPLATDKLLFHQMVAYEGVSRLFDYDLTVLSEDENIVLTALLGEQAHVELELPNDATRYFSGYVTRFSFLGFHGNFSKYAVKLRPWLWFLSRARNNRIFQQQTVPDIIKQVFADHGFTQDIEDKLTETYDQRLFCVQYRESDFDFVSRLMEDEGIYYYFVHEAGRHKLVLADGISAHQPFGDYECVPWFPPDSHDRRERDHLDHWELCNTVRSGKYSMRDFDFETSSSHLDAPPGAPAEIDRGHNHDAYEVYDYPGRFDKIVQGETYARKRIEALQADFEVLTGSGNARGMQPGHLFTLDNYDRDDQNREYLILSVTHDIIQDDYGSTSSSGSDFDYRCSLQAMPTSETFRPALTTPRPIVHGPQTAFVVGDGGDGEIWTDEHGRVKVEFHWDREDQKNSNSSCWVRVSQSWAGKGWGAQFLPRIGHEVIVEFLEGDPDRPIITGAVYNKSNPPPYSLPGNKTQSGIKTRSHKSDDAALYNEIRFEDKPSEEKLLFHAQKDMDITVENNRDEVVHCDETVEVKGDRTHTVGKDDTRNVKANDAETIDGRQTVKVKKDRDFTVQGNETRNVNLCLTETIGGTWTNTTTGGITITSPANINITSATQISLTDANCVHFGTFDLNFQGMAIGITGSTVDIKGNATGLFVTNIAVNGINMAYNGVDISKNGVEVTMKDVKALMEKISLKKLEMKLQKKAMEIVMGQLNIRKSSFSALL